MTISQKKQRRNKDKKSRVALVVLGMHRSGTSAMASVLGQMGADLPHDLMPPSEMNEKGYFESSRIMRLNDALLASAGQAWDSFMPFPREWFESPKAGEFHECSVDVLAEEFGKSHFFVMKDPRHCRLVPFWENVFETTKCVPHYVICLRSPVEVAESLETRYGFDNDFSQLLWLRHMLDAEGMTRGAARVFVSYDNLMSDWRHEVAAIGVGLGIKWPRTIDSMASAVEDLLSADLRHFDGSLLGSARGATMAGWIGETYQLLASWARDGERSSDFDKLNAIRRSYDAASPFFAPIADSAKALRLLQAEAQGKMDATEAKVQEIQLALHAMQAEAADHSNNHKVEQMARWQAETQLVSREAVSADLKARLGETSMALEKALSEERAAAQARAEADARLSAERDAARDALADLQAERATWQAEIEALKEQFASSEAAVHEKARSEAAALSAERDAARDALADVQMQFGLEVAELEQKIVEIVAQLEQETASRSHLASELLQRKHEADEQYARADKLEQRNAEMADALAVLEKRHADLVKSAQRDKVQLAILSQQALARIRNDLEQKLSAGSEAEPRQAAEIRPDFVGDQSGERDRDLLRQVSDLEHQLAELQSAMQHRESELGRRLAESESHRMALLQSTSWRITEPLRWLKRIIRND